MLVVQYGKEKVVHTSDVQGPSSKKTLEMILFEDPDLVIVGGQPLYLSGSKVPVSVIEQGFQNLQIMVRSVPVTILDHHIVRSEDWRIQVKKVFEEAERHGNQVLTAAEYVGKESMPLESMRKSLYESEPPSPEFMKWTTMPEMERKKTVPPL